MDEPFSSVDMARKVRLLTSLKGLLATQNRTTVFVTHDIDEALYIADTVLLIKEGEVTKFAVADEAEYGNSPLRSSLLEAILAK